MESSFLFIPQKIKVGFQKREDTFSGALAYIVYYRGNKICKEKSWENWRDKKIDPIEYENAPTEGFVFNKDVKRYNGDWWSSKRTMVRVFDPRGFEFEVTTANLIAILRNSDVSKRALVGKFLYSWSGPELVLLPINSEEYEKASSFTSLQSQKVSAKTLFPGCSYKTKREGNVIYLGKFDWYGWKDKNNKQLKYCTAEADITRTADKRYIFISEAKANKDDDYSRFSSDFIIKGDVSFLASLNSDQVVSNYAKLMDKFNRNVHSCKIVKFEVDIGRIEPKIKFVKDCGGYYSSDNEIHYKLTNNKLVEYNFSLNDSGRTYDSVDHKYNLLDKDKLQYVVYGPYQDASFFDTRNQKFISNIDYNSGQHHNEYYNRPKYTLDELNDKYKDFGKLFVTLENGERIKINNIRDI